MRIAWLEFSTAYSPANSLKTWFIMLHRTTFASGLELSENLPWIVFAGRNLFCHGLCACDVICKTPMRSA